MSKWSSAKYTKEQRDWCIAYESECGFEPLMYEHDQGEKTFEQAARSSIRWYEAHTSHVLLRLWGLKIPALAAQAKQGGAL